MKENIVITGSFGVGKSSLIKNLKGNISYIQFENARKKIGKNWQDLGKEELLEIALNALTMRINNELNERGFISDGGIFYDLAWIIALAEEFNVDINSFNKEIALCLNHAKQNYSKIFYIPIEFELKEQKSPFENPKIRIKINEIVLKLLKDNAFEYIEIKGTPENRLKIILES